MDIPKERGKMNLVLPNVCMLYGGTCHDSDAVSCLLRDGMFLLFPAVRKVLFGWRPKNGRGFGSQALLRLVKTWEAL